ncbi:hypothetical protein C8C77_12518 [Halanaerobium saccharolyticum]|uniref:Uncharacterized protein n=1 Tax=Halanaerobium saccharolyticum TaxID=43595 RepID=A0A4R7YSN3_9FIRM|nr:hypothetical protein [Halanaerobium saccharolyticum]RAK06299.1 hypothetical protein C7958_12416 [Halanaerobium saccharolyticum]TDW00778.1 hypothetical protein C8C77_12518 [Halanaerobium saccharolyticum]TDX52420.1 hypothetical protein C7956_12418 [Halanaerobium saccharolyticum]
MIEITGNDIKKLNDTDLRTLIGLLCEEELERSNISRKGVTWGGHQNARDGGVDVRVKVSSEINQDSFIPAGNTIFQVKATDMPAKEIIKEMCPKGRLRKTIKKLSDDNGAYVIVSSKGSVAEPALENRREAINSVLLDFKKGHNIKYDFYDRNRIASWVRSYPALIFWLRDKISAPVNGWQGYEGWINLSGNKYIVDEKVRLFNNTKSSSDRLPIVDGINLIREKMQQNGLAIRLVGLSGVGKTSLVQALFNEKIGKNLLEKTKVIYTDYSDKPEPPPKIFAQQLIALNEKVYLIIDNCPPDIHRKLTEICSNSLISLLTVEYDVKEDLPEETEVFYLEPASDELIEKVILNQYKEFRRLDARRIAEFSGGNSRIAKALANALNKDENISELKDEVLFNRLFRQRNEKNNNLLEAAEILALVYSFSIKNMERKDSELKILSSLSEFSSVKLCRYANQLQKRGLIQERGQWRAVLPRAIANRLAKRALEYLPKNIIYNKLSKSNRLLRSFSRRLSYLNNTRGAKQIANFWLAKGGILADLTSLDKIEVEILKNISLIIPENILLKFEELYFSEQKNKFFNSENDYAYEYAQILIYISYKAEYFNRAVKILILFTLNEKPNKNYKSVRKLLFCLFHIQLSGTHASPEQRLSVIKDLIESKSDNKVSLGLDLFKEALKTNNFMYLFNFSPFIGNRDYGYYPKTKKEVEQWYKSLLKYAVKIINSNDSLSRKIEEILGDSFRNLWGNICLYDELESLTQEIRKNNFWRSGLNGINRTLKYDQERMDDTAIERLKKLKSLLEPDTLEEEVELFLFSRHGIDLYGADNGLEIADRRKLVNKKAKSLGVRTAGNIELLKSLLSKLLFERSINANSFGQGLALGADDPEFLWAVFKSEIKKGEVLKCKLQLLKGFLNELADINYKLTNEILNNSLEDEVLAEIFPNLQMSYIFDKKGVTRLKKSLSLSMAPIEEYQSLTYNIGIFNDKDLAEIIQMILNKAENVQIPIEIFHSRLSVPNKNAEISDNLINTAHQILLNYSFENRNDHGLDFQISDIIKRALNNESSKTVAKIICEKLKVNSINFKIGLSDYNNVITALAQVQPQTFLNQFIGDSEDENRINYGWRNLLSFQANPLDQIDNQLIISWCEENKKDRYLNIIGFIDLFEKDKEDDSLRLSDLANLIINNVQDKIEILEKISKNIMPATWTWSGSEYVVIEKRIKAIGELKCHQNQEIAIWAKRKEIELTQIIEKEKQKEREQDLLYPAFE